jgi:UDP-MurNAc hydroxylase
MKFTIIGHACLLIEAGGERMLIDPWLVGSCYWRSWWHHPQARADLVEPASTSAIYYTHEHPDHLHHPSLRRFPREVRILIPRFPVGRMAPLLSARGFSRIEEVPHGGLARVGPLEIRSYQYGLDDSVVVVSDGETTLVNLNDAKSSGRALEQIRRRHAPIDFLFRSHAPAQSYPFCYSADVPGDLSLLGRDHYTRSFAAAVRVLRPRWAIPFASNVCYLHPESRAQNASMVSPADVVSACAGRLESSEVIAMYPGDSWDRDRGFVCDPARVPEPAEAAAARLANEHATALSRYAAEENAIEPIDAQVLGRYLDAFMRSVPWALRRAYPARVAFKLTDGTHLIADLGRARSIRVPEPTAEIHSLVDVNLRLLRDAVEKRCMNLVGISKRVHVHLRRGGLVHDAAFWGLLALYELEYLPLRKVFTPRAARALTARWRELASYLRALVQPSRSLEAILDTWDPR